MKSKQQTAAGAANKSRQSNNHNNKRVHKQFELLYRTREGLPSSEQYQSVFFMKHHKILASPQKNRDRVGGKKNSGNEKKKTQEKQDTQKKNEKTKEKRDRNIKLINTNSTVPFMGHSEKPLFSDTFRQTIDINRTNLHKISHTSNSNTSRYLNPKYLKTMKKSPNKKNKFNNTQLKEDFLETKKPSSRNASKISSPKNIQTSKRKVKELEQKNKIDQVQYVFINGQFVLGSEATLPDLKQEGCNTQQRNQFLEDILMQESEDNTLISHQNNQEISAIQKFILSKVLVIQRWWRKQLLKKNKKKNKQQKCQFDDKKFIELPSNNLENCLLKHEETILNVMNSHKSIINKLRQAKKINNEEYSERLSQIETNFQNQMLEINKVRGLVNKELQKFSKLQQKLSNQNSILEQINILPKEDIFAVIFQNNKENFNAQLFENRQKSHGCHYSEASTTPIHLIPQIQRQIFDKDSSDQNQEPEKDFQNQEITLSSNLQGTLDNFLSVYQDQQLIQAQIQKRYAIQVGLAIEEFQNRGISTSVLSIHNFLSSFLKFYEYFYKEEFLKLVNMPYGQSVRHRLKILQKPEEQQVQTEEDGIIYGLNSIISDQALEDYHDHNYSSLDLSDKKLLEIINYEKIHNRAIIDCFNESLNCFRPYYYVNGPPYSWNYSQRALTFYFIAQENVQQVFQKTEYKVLRNASFLCGMQLNCLQTSSTIDENDSLQQKMMKYRSTINPILAQARQEKINKLQKVETQEESYIWQNTEEQKTSLLLDISNVLLVQLALEAACQLPFFNL